MKKILKNLFVGQEVVPVNDGTIAQVLARVAPNKYKIAWKGHEIVTNRNQLSVRVHGRWVTGQNTTDLPPA